MVHRHAALWCVLATAIVTSAVPASVLQGAAEADMVVSVDKAPAAAPSAAPAAAGVAATSTAAPAHPAVPPTPAHKPSEQLHKGYKHGHASISKRNENAVLKSELYSEPPGGEFRYFKDDDRRRRSARIVRGPVKRSAVRPLTGRNKRDLQLDADDALALLALWASAAAPNPRAFSDYREGYPGRYVPAEPVDDFSNSEFENPEDNEIDDADVVLPSGMDDGYPGGFGAWGGEDYAVPDRFNVMRRSPGLYPILASYKREPGYAEVAAPSAGRWGGFAPAPHKRFMVSKRRSLQSGGDVYSLAQLLSEQSPEPTLPLYRRLMLQ